MRRRPSRSRRSPVGPPRAPPRVLRSRHVVTRWWSGVGAARSSVQHLGLRSPCRRSGIRSGTPRKPDPRDRRTPRRCRRGVRRVQTSTRPLPRIQPMGAAGLERPYRWRRRHGEPAELHRIPRGGGANVPLCRGGVGPPRPGRRIRLKSEHRADEDDDCRGAQVERCLSVHVGSSPSSDRRPTASRCALHPITDGSVSTIRATRRGDSRRSGSPILAPISCSIQPGPSTP